MAPATTPDRADPARHGGKPTLVVLVAASSDLLATVLPTDGERDGGTGLVAGVREHTAGSTTVELREGPAGGVEHVLGELQTGSTSLADVDVVVLSVAPDANDATTGRHAPEVAARFETAMAELAGFVKERGAHLIVFNASSFDPRDATSCYAGVDDTQSLVIQHLNRSLIVLSMLDGLSIIDVDRIMSELGGRRHVEEALSYSPRVHDSLCHELVRVLDDYGFFEDRPLLAQVGRRER